MEGKKVNKEQIDQLFDFVASKGVKFYDLQVELVDHFASAIEDEWRQDPDRNFTIMMTEIYRNFKDHEFKRLTRKKMQVLTHRSWKMAWSFLRSFFTWPKVALTVLMIITLHQVLSHFQVGMKAFNLFAIAFFVLIIGMWIYLYIKRPREKQFLVFNQTLMLSLAGFNVIALLFTQLPRWLDIEHNPLVGWQLWAASTLITVSFITCTGFFLYAHINMLRELEKAFPKYVR